MNLPNKLTVLRMVLVPLYLLAFYIESIPYNFIIALVIFAAASITDMFDGRIARRRGLVTNFGKFLDPLADKILVCSALAAFVEKDMAFSIAVICVMIRDFVVSGVRMIGVSSNGKVIAANMWGKVKTVIQMFYIMTSLLIAEIAKHSEAVRATEMITVVRYVSLAVGVVTLISGISYVKNNISVFKDQN